LISSLLTIVIPCKNSVYELKSTVESLSKQFKINNTKVYVTDLGSEDGSYQYAAQSSVEYFRILKIESIKIEKDLSLLKFMDQIETPYCMVILPGSNMEDTEFIFKSVNRIMSSNIPQVYLKQYPLFKRLNPFKNIKNGDLEISCVISDKYFLSEIQGNHAINIHQSQISKGKILVMGKL
jgi:hypothetical protein